MDTQDLMRATEAGEVRDVGTLLDAGADANARTAGGETPLMRAAARGHADVVQLLLERGANANLLRPDGWTALMLASFFGHADVVCTLVCAGADIRVSDRNGSDAVMWATSRGHVEVAKFLKDAKLLIGDFERGRATEHVPPRTPAPSPSAQAAEVDLVFGKIDTAQAFEDESEEGALKVEGETPSDTTPRPEAGAAARPLRALMYGASLALLVAAGGVLAYFYLNLKASPSDMGARPAASVEAQTRPVASGGASPQNAKAAEPLPPALPSETVSPVVAPDIPSSVANFPAAGDVTVTSPAATKSVRGRTAASLTPVTRDATVISTAVEPSVVREGAEGNAAESRREASRGASPQSPAASDTVERREADAAPSSAQSAPQRQSQPAPEPSTKKKPKEIRWP